VFDWGTSVDVNVVKNKVEEQDYDIIAVVHAETSTGVKNDVENISAVINPDSIFIVDAVTSLGTIDLQVDNWNIDAVYSCSQKGLSCPPGASPISFSKKAINKMKNRDKMIPNWYLDMLEIIKYWDGNQRAYHHTAPINMMYALYQSLLDLVEEGLDNVHDQTQSYLNLRVTDIKHTSC
jgi:alanine-glyoxylate transaminase/serine-glyoxylate transaminase/serine-pyruvate transaminase